MVKSVFILALVLASAARADDLQTLRDRYFASITARPAGTSQAPTTPAAEHLKTQQADGSWKDIDFTDGERTYWPARLQLQRAVMMAKEGHSKNDDKLTSGAYKALAFWLEHDYQNPNWWWNQIGVPALIGDISLLTKPKLSQQQIAQCAAIMKRATWQKWTGQNLVWGAQIQIVRGLLEDSPPTVAEGFDAIYGVIRIVDADKEGVQSDFSFHQHGQQFYSGGYGMDFALDTSRYAALAWGTKFQIPEEKLKLVTSYVLDGEQWMMRGSTFDYSAVGREIVRVGKSGQSLFKGVDMLASLPVPRRDELAAFAARIHGDTTSEFVGNKHFWMSDYMSHRREKYFTSVRMYSDRLLNTEQANNEGRKSQHLADGANFLYLTGNEYRDIFPVWDWTKVPGTTAEQGTLDIGEKAIGVKGKTNFVGGVSDGMYGLAAMDLSRGKLAAHKAWFFFDDEYVCLGAGITCSSENPTATTLNQCLLHGEVSRRTNWVHHDSVGYLLPRDTKFFLTANPQSGRWSEIGAQSNELLTRNVFTAYIDHGAHPQNASYEYRVLPGATVDETEKHASAPADVEVITNQPDIQAVANRRLKILMIAFWNAGKVETAEHSISVDRACLVLLRDRKLFMSNPTNQPALVKATVGVNPVSIELPAGPHAGSSVGRDLKE